LTIDDLFIPFIAPSRDICGDGTQLVTEAIIIDENAIRQLDGRTSGIE